MRTLRRWTQVLALRPTPRIGAESKQEVEVDAHALDAETASALQGLGILREAGPILCACSGGGDSVALAHLLHRIGFAIELAHLNHQTRGAASDGDARFVVRLGQDLGVPVHVESAPIAREAEDAGANFEAYARERRYAWLAETAQRRQCIAIATGHTLDDQAETLVMRLLRGTGPTGFGGIAAERPLGDLRVVRPLLRIRRERLRKFLRAADLDWREDATNDDTARLRAHIRARVIPALERAVPHGSALESMVRSAGLVRDDGDFLDRLAAEAEPSVWSSDRTLDRHRFAELPVPLQRRILRRGWLSQQGADGAAVAPSSARHIEELRTYVLGAKPGDAYQAPGKGFVLRATPDHVLRVADQACGVPGEIALDLPPAPGHPHAVVDAERGMLFSLATMAYTRDGAPAGRCSDTVQVFDAERAGRRLYVRARRDGDRLAPLGMAGTKKVSDLLIDAGIPLHERAQVPLIWNEDDLLWVVGCRVGRPAAVTPNTRTLLRIEVERAPRP